MDDNRDPSHTQLTPLQERLKREEEERNKRLAQKKEKGKAGYFISGLSGVIVGALLMWLLMPSLANQLPGSTTEIQGQSSSTTGIKQTATVVTTDVTTAVEKVSEAVVGISNYQVIQNSLGGFWFGQGGFSGTQQNEQEQGELQEAGTGSGVVYKIENGEAYIVTNHHVIEDAEKLEITLADGSKKEATLIGSDIWTDLAVIKVDADGIETVANFGDSEVLKQGEAVIAIGNPLGLDFYGSVTVGVISGTNRAVPVDLNGDGTEDWQSEVLQTDAAINGGNSGGALVNLNGDLIGINSMKIASEAVEGLGFAIPINTVIPIIQQLEGNGQVVRPAMGVSLMDLTDVPAFYQAQTLQLPEGITTGVVVAEIVKGSAAEEAGMKQYDVIFEMDGQTIESVIDLRKHLYTKTAVGETLNVKVYRAGKVVELNLILKESST
ncbi:MAG: S1C family serine protease [Lysinibacillus sp.]